MPNRIRFFFQNPNRIRTEVDKWLVSCNQMADVIRQWWRRLMNAYEVKAGMMCLQCNNCVIHTWALQRRVLTVGRYTNVSSFTFIMLSKGSVLLWMRRIQIVTLASTTFLLAAMSFDRYLAICRPMKSLPAASQSRRWRMIVTAWIMAFVFASPQFLIFKQVHTEISVVQVTLLKTVSLSWRYKICLLYTSPSPRD